MLFFIGAVSLSRRYSLSIVPEIFLFFNFIYKPFFLIFNTFFKIDTTFFCIEGQRTPNLFR